MLCIRGPGKTPAGSQRHGLAESSLGAQGTPRRREALRSAAHIQLARLRELCRLPVGQAVAREAQGGTHEVAAPSAASYAGSDFHKERGELGSDVEPDLETIPVLQR